MTDRRFSARASILSFLLITAIAVSAATGLFVLLDPRAQAYWASRGEALVDFVRALFGGG